MKKCTKCFIEKELVEYHKHCRRPSGLDSQCKECRNSYHRENMRARRLETPEWNRTARKTRLDKKYGMTIDDYDKMFKDQGGICLICRSPPSRKRLAIDHCHKTNKVRGLLCSNCNMGLGLLKDSPRIMINAIRYLRKNQVC